MLRQEDSDARLSKCSKKFILVFCVTITLGVFSYFKVNAVGDKLLLLTGT